MRSVSRALLHNSLASANQSPILYSSNDFITEDCTARYIQLVISYSCCLPWRHEILTKEVDHFLSGLSFLFFASFSTHRQYPLRYKRNLGLYIGLENERIQKEVVRLPNKSSLDPVFQHFEPSRTLHFSSVPATLLKSPQIAVNKVRCIARI